MSDYHIMGGTSDGNRFTVVFHLSIPNTDNSVNVNYRTALIQSLGGSQASAVPWLAAEYPAEQAQLDAGELYEHIYTLHTNPGQTLVNNRDFLDALFASFSSAVITQLQARLSYWGYDRDVP